MRCELFEQLIPLFVGGDLEPHEADELQQHLNSCAHCRRLNQDFQASQNWLTGFAVPEFDEASFAKMRASVLFQIKGQIELQIERQEKRGRWPDFIDWLLPKFSPRFVLASAAIALAVITGLVTAVYRQQMAPAKTSGETVADVGRINIVAGKQHSEQKDNRVATASRSVSRSNHSKAASTLLPPEAFNNGGFEQPLEPPVIVPDQPTVEEAAPVEPEEKEMLRIELQTADPNIRIIWLTPKSGSPTNSQAK